MPQRTYFDPDFDYSKAMQEAIAEGDITNLGALARQRELKIASDPTKYGNVKSTADVLGEYAYLADTNPAMEDYGIAVNEARGVTAPVKSNPTPIIGQYEQMMSDYREQLDALQEARKQETLPFDHPDLIKDDSNDNEEIL